jgi:hypothetical protein
MSATAAQIPPGKLKDESFVADFTGRSTASLRRDRASGVGIPYIKMGRLVRYDMRDVEAYLKCCKRKSKSASSGTPLGDHEMRTRKRAVAPSDP